MSDVFDESDEIVAEDWPTFYTQVPVWVLLAPIPAQAYRMYAFLAEHINVRTPGQRIACPKQKAIARALGLSNPRQVAPYGKALEELGAVRIEEYRYANGMRRGYRYYVRFNPPAGYDGLVALKGFYEANPDLQSARAQGRVAAAKEQPITESAGQNGGTKNSTAGGTEKSTSRGAKNRSPERDQQERDQQERDDAPSARSAADARRASTGSRGSSVRGSAASGKSHPRLTPDQKRTVQAVRDLLPPDLNRVLPVKTPRNVADAILAGLAAGQPRERTAQQLVEFRVMRRWDGFWAAKLYAGELVDRSGRTNAVGAFLQMLRDTAECGSCSCEDRFDMFTGEACRACEQRAVDRKADRAAARPGVPASELRATVPAPAKPTPVPDPVPAPAVGGGADPTDYYRQMRAATRQRARR